MGTGENWAIMQFNEGHRWLKGMSETGKALGDCLELGQSAQTIMTLIIFLHLLHPERSHDPGQGWPLVTSQRGLTAEGWQLATLPKAGRIKPSSSPSSTFPFTIKLRQVDQIGGKHFLLPPIVYKNSYFLSMVRVNHHCSWWLLLF